MMHQCSGSHGNMTGPCSCGMFHSSSFSMLFSVPNQYGHNHNHNYKSFGGGGDEADVEMYTNYASSPSSVDCTLSLGTPSTRLTESDNHHDKRKNERRSAGSYVSSFCWDLLHPKHSSQQKSNGRTGGGGSGNTTSAVTGDPLLARRCANCDTTSTPLWRNGPRGPKSLCNACGIRFKKEERRASAAAATTATVNNTPTGGGNYTNSSWIPHHSQTTSQKIHCMSPAAINNNEFMFMEDDNRNEPENGISFLSWRLNVTDRPSLVHDFTR